ncbi:MAG: hypothetical protein AB8B72_02285 [Crocinitomicaceae bacterium]
MPFNRADGDFIEIRPRFKLKSTLPADKVIENLMAGLKSDDTVLGRKVLDVFYLDIPNESQKYWSPELRASIEKNEAEEGSFIRVVIGPRHKVWVLFVFLYTLLGFICLFGGMYGMAQWNLGIDSLWIYFLPIMLSLIASLYIIAKLGQRATRDESLHLSSYLYHNIRDGELERVG